MPRRRGPRNNSESTPLKLINGIRHQLFEFKVYSSAVTTDGGTEHIMWFVRPAFLQRHEPNDNVTYTNHGSAGFNHPEIRSFVFLPVQRDRGGNNGELSKMLVVIEEAITAARFPEDFVPVARELVEKMRCLLVEG